MQFIRAKINQLAMLKQQAEAANANAKKGLILNNIAPNGNNNNNNGGKKANPSQNMGFKPNPGAKMSEGKRGNDISSMMNLAGFHGNGAAATINPNGNGFQVQPNNVYPGLASGHNNNNPMMNMNGFQQYNNAMNLQNRQPQMMYNRSPFVPPSTGYYYNYGHGQVLPYSYNEPGHGYGDHTASHMFSDENPSSCSVM
ncbi:hypothetical protein ACJIZ3_019614 [Penstemon smallii]|uniref:Uncharacterized protein n=1 Tax=Penstemon smallii TaxID=265156 RepID=A0ABD3T377_9LAMI